MTAKNVTIKNLSATLMMQEPVEILDHNEMPNLDEGQVLIAVLDLDGKGSFVRQVVCESVEDMEVAIRFWLYVSGCRLSWAKLTPMCKVNATYVIVSDQ